MCTRFAFRSLVALLAMTAFLAACGGEAADTSSVDLPDGGEAAVDLDPVGDDEAVEDQGETVEDDLVVAENLCKALPIDEVTQLFADTIGEPADPFAIRTDDAETCYVEEESIDSSSVSLALYHQDVGYLCQTASADEPIDGVGDLACWAGNRNANSLGIDFAIGDVGYTVVVDTNDSAFDGDFYDGRSEAGAVLVEDVAALAASNLP